MDTDPQVDALLEELAASGRPSSLSLPLPEGRRNFRELFAPLGTRPEVESVSDRVIPGAAGDVRVRLYAPRTAPDGEGVVPVLLFFHGGGWMFGDLDTADGICRGLASTSGANVVSVDYRLAPEHPFPAALEDALAALRWAHEAGSLGARAARVAVGGDSSGANIAAAVALKARDDAGPPVAFQLLIYPTLDASMSGPSLELFADDPWLSAAEVAGYWSRYLAGAPADDPYASPAAAADLARLPPAHVITAAMDPLRDEGEAYAERLRAAGVHVTSRRYEGVPHGFMSFDAKVDLGGDAIRDAGEALGAALVAGWGDPAPATGRADR